MFKVECGKGWQRLYTPLLEVCKLTGVEVLQVKEKFGTLRFYTGKAPAWLDDLITLAEAQSAHVCEICGAEAIFPYKDTEAHARGKTVKMRTKGWWKTLCDPCAEAKGVE